jgi:Na+-transporting methylmalonyl-CoA/oxaloacetate decarboxylase gamma subunit
MTSEVRRPLPASVVSAANDAFVHGVHVVAATNSLLMVAMAVVAAVFLRHVKAPAAQPEAEPVAAPAQRAAARTRPRLRTGISAPAAVCDGAGNERPHALALRAFSSPRLAPAAS